MEGDAGVGRPQFAMLGPLEIVGAGGKVRARSRLQRLLLSILLVDANRFVSDDRLIEEMWGDRLPEHPRGALRTQVSRLRRMLPPGVQLLAGPAGHRLVVPDDAIDARRFEQLLADAAACPDEVALGLLDEAVALWRGRPLDEFTDLHFAQVEQRRLVERYDAALERRIGLLVAAGRDAEAVTAAQALVAQRPERERARALLMEALYRTGRATEALDTYRSWRLELSERGLEPSPEIQEVEVRILRHSVSTTAEPIDSHRVATPRVPRSISSFIGRDEEVSQVASLLPSRRLVTLWGPGGVGKTRLATEVAVVVAGHYADGVYFCDLSTLSDGTAVARVIANAVGVHERGGRRLETQIVERMMHRHSLLILDNCEHVLPTTASIAQELLRSTSGVDVLATSRERLAVEGEQLWEVAALDANGPDSAAVKLFVDRARATVPTFAPTADELELIASVCQRLDGLPLAIEFGAARLRGLPVRALVDALDSHPEVLHGGAGSPARHRSLRAVFEWSYSLLDPIEQRVFDRLAVLRGSFGFDAARAVAIDDDLASDDLDTIVLGLLDRALLVERADDSGSRYSMLATVRRYGIDHLEADGSFDRTAERHARWTLVMAEEASRRLASTDEAAAATTIENNLDNLRVAHRWLVGNDPEGSLRLIAALRPYALWRGHAEIFRWSETAVARTSTASSTLLCEAQLAASTGAWQRGDLVAARSAADSITNVGTGHSTRAALEASADVALLAGDLKRARAEFTRAHRLALADADELQAVWDIGSAAVAAGYAGDTSDALELADATATIAARSGSPSAQAFAQFAIGEILASQQPAAAEQHLLQAIELSKVAGSRFVTGLAEVALAALHGRGDDIPAAIGHCLSALHRWRQAGAWTPLWVTMRTVVAVLERAESLEAAATLLAAVEAARTGATPFGIDAADMHQTGQRLRLRLGDTVHQHLECGRSMSGDAAVELAIDALEQAATRLLAIQ